ACKVQLTGKTDKPEATVQLATNNGKGSWVVAGKFSVPVVVESGKVKAEAFGDSLAEEVLRRLVSVKLIKGSKVKGKKVFGLKVENNSPVILNGLAISGSLTKPNEPAKALLGIALQPRRSLVVPASAEAVEAQGLDKGIRVLALDLSGL